MLDHHTLAAYTSSMRRRVALVLTLCFLTSISLRAQQEVSPETMGLPKPTGTGIGVAAGPAGSVSASGPTGKEDEIVADLAVDVNLVTLTVAVTDQDGAPVQGLTAQRFTVLDEGDPREINGIWQDNDLPLTVGLIVDISGSQHEFWNRHRRAARVFLNNVLQPGDQAFLVSVGSDGVRLVTDLTSDIRELDSGITRLGGLRSPGPRFGDQCPIHEPPGRYVPIIQSRPQSCFGTPLWNGVYSAVSERLRDVRGRKALIVLSDGEDTGSQHRLSDAIESAQSANTPIFSILSTGPSERLFSPLLGPLATRMNGGIEGPRDLTKLSEYTGGRRFSGDDEGSAKVFDQIEQELRSQYVLTFTPPAEARDGRFHELKVKVDQKDVTVRARRGYLASEK